MENWENHGFGIYIHWPFCAAKCPYCDFNSHVRKSINQKQWCDAYLQELKSASLQTPNRIVRSIFFGGGTPSLMDSNTVAKLIEAIGHHWTITPNTEITLEANPTSVEAKKFIAFANAGVNRVSMGIQSLINKDLKILGRMHTVEEAKYAFDIAKTYFKRVSFDLIYARQNQTLQQWEKELNDAIAMSVDHLSLYQLTIENGTRFGHMHKRGLLRGMPSDDLAADMYELTQDITSKQGMNAYEISNHAKPGAQSQHNLIYWQYGDYIGIGPGAHGRISKKQTRIATITPNMPEEWLKTVEQFGTATKISEIISPKDQATEYLMMSLRLSTGTNINRYNALGQQPLNQKSINKLTNQKLITQYNNHIVATKSGKIILNTLLKELLFS